MPLLMPVLGFSQGLVGALSPFTNRSHQPLVTCKACATHLKIPPAPIASGRKAEQSGDLDGSEG